MSEIKCINLSYVVSSDNAGDVENASKNQYFEKFAEILGTYGKAISLGGDIYHSIR